MPCWPRREGGSWRQKCAHGASHGQQKSGERKSAYLSAAVKTRGKRKSAAAVQPAGRDRVGGPLRMRSARRSPASWRSAICSRPPTSMSANGAGSTPSRRALNIWRALRRFLSTPREAAGPELQVRQDFFDLRTLARNAGDSLTGRAAAKGLKSSGRYFRKTSRIRGWRSRSPARGAGKPDRQRGEVHRLMAASRCGVDADFESTRGRIAIAFAVSDSGIGLTLAEIKRLFRPFSQANVTIASRFGGAGLGLSSVKQLARAMGGDIVVTQRHGGGTTFTFPSRCRRRRRRRRPRPAPMAMCRRLRRHRCGC